MLSFSSVSFISLPSRLFSLKAYVCTAARLIPVEVAEGIFYRADTKCLLITKHLAPSPWGRDAWKVGYKLFILLRCDTCPGELVEGRLSNELYLQRSLN